MITKATCLEYVVTYKFLMPWSLFIIPIVKSRFK